MPRPRRISVIIVGAGFGGWYRSEGRRIVANWPGYMTEYAERVRELDPSEFTFAPAAYTRST